MSNFFRTNLIFLRQQHSKTQADIGFAVEKKGNTVGYWEKGDYEPNISEIEKIAQLFDITPIDLLYKDLANVHLKNIDEEEKEVQNVHLNVHPSVHLKGVKHPKSTGKFPVFVEESGNEKLFEAQQKTIQTLESLNGLLTKRVAELEEINLRLTREIPEIGSKLEDKQQQAG
jgi:DNA-binding XRE family transcriptional regulator